MLPWHSFLRDLAHFLPQLTVNFQFDPTPIEIATKCRHPIANTLDSLSQFDPPAHADSRVRFMILGQATAVRQASQSMVSGQRLISK